mgnify:CR=1 FL=1
MERKRIEPEPGKESVWDYPRPPRVEDSTKHIVFNNVVIAETRRAKRVLETSSPPVYYIPTEDIEMEYLKRTQKNTICEWKGIASYYTVIVGDKEAKNAAWFYPNPQSGYTPNQKSCCILSSKNGCLLCGRRTCKTPTGRFLWGLDYRGHCGTI